MLSVGDRCIAQYGRILEPSMRCGVPLECLSRVCLTGFVSSVDISLPVCKCGSALCFGSVSI